jgi:GTPase SAR1 family protein
LGAGESGKTTLFKQMIQIYGQGWDEAKKKAFVPIIRGNVLKYIIHLTRKLDNCPAEIASSKEFIEALDHKSVQCPAGQPIDPDIVRHVTALWTCEPMQVMWREKFDELQQPNCAQNFLDRVNEIASAGYLPSFQDILACRVSTTGIVETDFTTQEERFRMFDVGGQRNERRKWIHSFEHVNLLIFVVAIDQYNQKMFEDKTKNRITDSLELFENTACNKWFKDKDIVLFLNRSDLFKKKIETVPLTACDEFLDYKGKPGDWEEAYQAIKDKFLERNQNKDRIVKVHLTCTIDTDHIKVIFETVKKGIITRTFGDVFK